MSKSRQHLLCLALVQGFLFVLLLQASNLVYAQRLEVQSSDPRTIFRIGVLSSEVGWKFVVPGGYLQRGLTLVEVPEFDERLLVQGYGLGAELSYRLWVWELGIGGDFISLEEIDVFQGGGIYYSFWLGIRQVLLPSSTLAPFVGVRGHLHDLALDIDPDDFKSTLDMGMSGTGLDLYAGIRLRFAKHAYIDADFMQSWNSSGDVFFQPYLEPYIEPEEVGTYTDWTLQRLSVHLTFKIGSIQR